VETPTVVRQRYASGRDLTPPAPTVTSPADIAIADGTSVRVTGTTNFRSLYIEAYAELVE